MSDQVCSGDRSVAHARLSRLLGTTALVAVGVLAFAPAGALAQTYTTNGPHAATINVNTTTTLDATAGVTAEISGQVTGSAELNIGGPGVIVFSNALNDWTGQTRVHSGATLRGTTDAIKRDVTFASAYGDLEFNQTASGTYAGSVSGQGNVRVFGLGAGNFLTFTGAHTQDGGIQGGADGHIRIGQAGSVILANTAAAVALNEAGASLDNAGTLSTTGSSELFTVQLSTPATVNNLATGRILRTGEGGAIRADGALTLDNAGEIDSTYHGLFLVGGGAITNSGKITADEQAVWFYSIAGGTVTNTATGEIISSGGNAIRANEPVTVDNAGRLEGYAEALYLTGSSSVTNRDGGVITNNTYGSAIFNGASSGTTTVTNEAGGAINSLMATVEAYNALVVDNSGSISGGDGVWARSGGTITNRSGAEILANDLTGYGVWSAGGADLTVDNAGTIYGGDLAISAWYDGKTTIINSGLIEGGNSAIALSGGDDSVTLKTGSTTTGAVRTGSGKDTVDIEAGAILTGGLDTEDDDDTVTIAAAQITGGIQFGAGADSITLTGATVDGVLNGQDGDDTITITGGSVGTITGGEGKDTITISGGTVLTGGLDSEGDDDIVSITGGSVAGGIQVGAGNDQITLTGVAAADVLNAQDGDDTITIVGGSIGTITGGFGKDTITISGGAVLTGGLDSEDDDDVVSITGGSVAGGIQVGGGNDRITLTNVSAADVLNGQDGNDEITVDGGFVGSISGNEGADTILVTGGATVNGDLSGNEGDDFITVGAGVNINGGAIGGNDGSDTVTLLGGITTTYGIYGGADAGTDTLVLGGTGTAAISFDDFDEFEVLTKAGTGTWTLSGEGYWDELTINAGTGAPAGKLIFDSTGSLHNTINVNGATIRAASGGAFGTGAIHAIDARLEYGATGVYSNPISLEVVAPTTATTLAADSGITANLGGAITRGAGDTAQPLVIAGAGTINLTNTNNAWTGVTTINAGATLMGGSRTISGASIVNNGTLNYNQTSNNTASQAISGTGNFIKTGAFNLTLGGAGTWTGTTTISAGTLTGAVANIGGSSVVNNATLAFSQPTNATFDKAISGTGAVSKSGAGNLTLTGAGSWGGTTTISAGTLTVSTASLAGSAVTNNAALVFDQGTDASSSKAISGTGTVTKTGAGNLTLTGSGSWTGITTISAGTLTGTATTIGGASIVNNGTLAYNQGTTASVSKAISGTGNVTKLGVGNLTLSGAGSWTGTTTVSAGTLTGTAASIGGSSVVNNATLALNQATDATFSKAISGSGAFTKSGVGNLTLSGAGSWTGTTTISAGTLTATAASLGGSSVANNATLVFDQTADASFGTVISGTGALTKSGAGNLTLTGVGSWGGLTTISAGTLTGTASSLAGSSVVNNGTLVFDQAADASYSKAISGTGAVTKLGAGNLTLSGAGSWTGLTTISAGTLTATTASFGGSSVENNAALVLNQTTDATLSKAISGTGSFTKLGAGNLTLSGAGSWTGTTTISAGTLTGTAASLGGGSIINNASLVYDQASTGSVAKAISGSGAFTKLGAGDLTLSGAGTWTGTTTISAGTLTGAAAAIGGSSVVNNAALVFDQTADASFGTVISGTGALTKSGAGNLTLTGAGSWGGLTTISAGTLTGTTSSLAGSSIVNNGTLAFNQAADASYSKAISGTGAVTKLGAGNLTLSGAGTWGGVTTISAGTLTGTTLSLGGSNVVNNAALVFDQAADATFSKAISGSGAVTKLGAGNLTLSGAGSWTGATTISAGTLTASAASLGGSSVTNNAALVFDQTADGSVGAAISGTGSVTKSGAGALTLAGAGGWTGTTTVSAGTLTVSASSLGGSSVVNDAALVFDQGVDASFGKAISGTGAVSKLGAGNLTLTGAGGWTGLTTILAGTLTGTAASLGGSALVNNATLVFDQGTDASYSKAISGTGAVSKLAAGNLTLSGAGSWGGVTTISAGTLTGTAASIGGASIANNAALVYDQASAGSASQAISGTGSFTKLGAGNLTLAGAGSWTGLTTISAGTLTASAASLGGSAVDNNAALVFDQAADGNFSKAISGSGSVTKSGADNLTLTGAGGWTGTTTLSAGTLTANAASLGGSSVLNNAALIFDQAADASFGKAISGSGSFTKLGVGNLTLSGAGSWGGLTTISAGTLTANAASLGGSSIANNAALVFDQTADATFGKAISGSGAVTKLGAGNLTLTGAGGWTGLTTISAGTLTTSAAGLGGASVVNNGALILDQASTATLSKAISGGGSFTKTGAGDLTLTGAGTWTGTTTISGGSLTGSLASLGGASVINNGSLVLSQPGSGTFGKAVSGTGAVTVTGLTPGQDLTFSGAVTNAGGLVGGAGGRIGVAATGSVATGGGSAVTLEGVDSSLTNAGTISGAYGVRRVLGGPATITSSGTITGTTRAISLEGNFNDVVILAAGSVTNGDVDLGDGDDALTLVDSAVLNGSVDGGAGFDSLTLDGAGSQSITGNITGIDNFTKIGAGDWTLIGATTLGTVAIQAGTGTPSGTLIFQDTGAITNDIIVNGATIQAKTDGAFGSGTIHMIDPTARFSATGTYGNNISLEVVAPATADPSTLIADAGVVATLTGAITRGAGDAEQPLVIGGAGKFVLTNTGNSWAGTTTINAGATLQGTSATISGGSVVANGALVFDQASDGAFSKAISGAGGLTKFGAGNLTLSGAGSWAGATTISAGALTASAASLGGSAVVNNASLVFNQASDASFGKAISGAGAVTKAGVGNLALTGAGGWTGLTTISAGTLTGNASSLGGSSITNNATLAFDQGADATFAKAVSGTGSVTKSGIGNLTLTGAGDWTGLTTISAGTLTANTASLGGSSIVNNAALVFDQAAGASFGKAISGAGSVTKLGAGSLTLTGAGGWTGLTTISAGTVVANASSLGGSSVVNNATLTFDQATDGTFGKAISGTGGVSKLGAGNLTLTGAGSWTGLTLVSAGTLTANAASLGGSSITNNAALVFDQATDAAFGKAISGTGSVTKTGAGKLTLTGTGGWTGITTISAGTLEGGVASIGGSSIVNNGTLALAQATSADFAKAVSGTGIVSVSGLNAGESLTFTGALTNAGGILAGANGRVTIGATGSVNVSGGAAVLLDGAGASVVNRGAITGPYGISRLSGGAATITSSGTITGTIKAISLQGAYDDSVTLTGGSVTTGGVYLGEGDDRLTLSGALTLSGGVDGGLGADAIVLDGSGAQSLNGAITGVESVTKTGAGTITLTGDSTWDAVTTISGGVLQGTTTSLGGSRFVNDATLAVVQSTGGDFTRDVSGAGVVTISGQGVAQTVAVSGDLTNAGGLSVGTNGHVAIASTGSVTVASGAAVKLDGAGASLVNRGEISGATGISRGATGGPASIRSFGTIAGTGVAIDLAGAFDDNLVLEAGSHTIGDVRLGDGNDSLTLVDSASLAGSVDGGAGNDALVLDGAGAQSITGDILGFEEFRKTGGGTWSLIGATTLGTSPIEAGNGTPSGALIFKDTAPITNDIIVNGATIRAESDGAFGSGTIHMIDPTAQFGATGTYGNNISLEVVAPASADPATLIADAGVTATLTGAITRGAGDPVQPLVIGGLGRIVLTNTGNLWTGTTTVNAGATLQGTAGSISGSAIFDNGTLIYDQASAGAVSQAISGSGAVTKTGAGNLTLSGAGTWTGTTTISTGTLTASAASLGGSAVVNNAALVLDQSTDGTVGKAISGTGSLTKTGAGNLTLTGAGGWTGATTISTGALIGTTATVGGGSIINNAALIYDQTTSGLVAKVVSGTGALTKRGTGVVTLTGVHTYTGATTIEGGTLAVSGSGSLAASQGVTITAGIFDLSGATTGASVTRLNGAGAVALGAKTLTVTGGTGSYAGAISGSGGFTLAAGNQTLSGASSYTGRTRVLAGTLTLAGAAPTIDLSALEVSSGAAVALGSNQSVAGLSGAGTLSLAANTLTLGGDNASTAYAGAIGGTGGLTKIGTGTFTLAGTHGYTGATTVTGGAFVANGEIAGSAVTVGNGALLKGTGRIGGLTVASGGQVAPGNSMGALTVAGNVVFAAGSTYQVEANAAGAADRIVATGTAQLNGDVEVLAEPGVYGPETDYTILSATGGVTGQFTGATSNLALLTPVISYTPGEVKLRLVNNGVFFDTYGKTDNQKTVARALNGGPTSGALYTAIVSQTKDSIAGSFDAVSGEAHASALTILADQGRHARDGVFLRLAEPATGGGGVWGKIGGQATRIDGQNGGNTAQVVSDATTVMFGADGDLGGWRLGVSASQDQGEIKTPSRGGRFDAETARVALYLGTTADVGFNARFGVSQAHVSVDGRRNVAFPGLVSVNDAAYGANVGEAFGEVGYRATLGSARLEPFVSLATTRLATDAFHETGNAATLDVDARAIRTLTSGVGLRASGEVAVSSRTTVRPYGAVSWLHVETTGEAALRARFQAGGPDFTVRGAAPDHDAAGVEAGLLAEFGKTAVAVGYNGELGDGWQSYQIKLSARRAF